LGRSISGVQLIVGKKRGEQGGGKHTRKELEKENARNTREKRKKVPCIGNGDWGGDPKPKGNLSRQGNGKKKKGSAHSRGIGRLWGREV